MIVFLYAISIKVISLAAITLVVSCANKEMPRGGPRDATPPVILEYSPVNNTLNFRDESIVVLFDDYMNRQTVIQNLYITPEIKVEYDWSGRELEIGFLEELKDNTTYAVTLDGGYTDRFGNQPESPFTFIFSTGTDLDSASITGMIQGSSETLYAMLWRQDSTGTFPDITSTAADYRLKIPKGKQFSFKGLKEGTYRIVSLDDKFQDGIVDFNSDGFSAYKHDITLSEGELVTAIELFQGPPIDTTAPSLVSAFYRNPNAFSVRLSEQIVEESLAANTLLAYDSIGNPLKIIAVLPDTTERDLVIAVTETMSADMPYEVFIEQSEKFIADSSGNSVWPMVDTLTFTTPEEFSEADTPVLKLTDISIQDSMKGFDYRDTIILQFNYPLTNSSLTSGFKLFDHGKEQSGISKRTKSSPDDSLSISSQDSTILSIPKSFRIEKIFEGSYALITELEERTKYRLVLDTNQLSIPMATQQKYSNDSTAKLSYVFSTGYKPDFSEVVGEIKLNVECRGLVVLTAHKENEEVFRLHLEDNQKLGPLQLEPGNYTFKAFCDENENDSRDYGYPNPFRFAETEYLITQKLSVKPKWDINDFIISIEGEPKTTINEDLPTIPLKKDTISIPKR